MLTTKRSFAPPWPPALSSKQKEGGFRHGELAGDHSQLGWGTACVTALGDAGVVAELGVNAGAAQNKGLPAAGALEAKQRSDVLQ